MEFKIAIIQYDIQWELIKENMEFLESLFNKFVSSIDLVILPEMFLTGFSMNVDSNSIELEGEEVAWLKEQSKKKNVAILGSLAVKENGKVFNRALFIQPDGNVVQYNKRHLFRMGGEDKYYTNGIERTVITYKNIRILPQICYDLRFPVWSRNKNDYDLLIYMANWPASRQKVWDILLPARAIENQSYTIGVNRVGNGGGLGYIGGSKVVDFKGDIVCDLEDQFNIMEIVSIDIEKQDAFRKKFPVYLDSDNFSIK